MSDWIDGDEKNGADFVIFPPEKVDAFTDDEEVNENAARLVRYFTKRRGLINWN